MREKEYGFNLNQLTGDTLESNTDGAILYQYTDEWLHSFYYYNDEIPTEADFMNSIADYLTFEFNMITHGKGYLFGQKGGDGNA